MPDFEKLFVGSTELVFPQTVTLRGIFNTHTHFRDPYSAGDGRSELFIPHAARIYEDAISIGNTKTPITTTAQSAYQKGVWQDCVPQGQGMRVHVAPLVIETSVAGDILHGLDHADVREAPIFALKMFLRAVSNSGGSDVDDLDCVIGFLKSVADKWSYVKRSKKPVLKIHAERKFTLLGRRIGFLDRERVAMDRDVERILKEVPNLEVEICHVSLGSTIEAIDYLRSKGHSISGEIAPQYSAFTTDDLFEDGKGGTGLNTHRFCLPIFKTPQDRTTVLGAMTSGKSYFHFGNDDACHVDDMSQENGVKTNKHGITVGGQTQIPEAVVSYIIEEFVRAGRTPEDMQAFLSDNARELYGLPAGTRERTFVLKDWVVPEYIEHTFLDGKTIRCRVAMGGQVRRYQLAE